jgi:hypothetical protein
MHEGDGALRSRSLNERRRDEATADTVEVALLYLRVFGHGAARQYLPLTDIPANIVRRILDQDGLRRRQ